MTITPEYRHLLDLQENLYQTALRETNAAKKAAVAQAIVRILELKLKIRLLQRANRRPRRIGYVAHAREVPLLAPPNSGGEG